MIVVVFFLVDSLFIINRLLGFTQSLTNQQQSTLGTMSALPPDDPLNEGFNKLKGQSKSIDQRELEERIARFKGIDPAKFTVPPITVYRTPDTRSDIQKADDLMAALMNETAIDISFESAGKTTSTSIEEIEKRLQSLRGSCGNDEKNRKTTYYDSDDEMDSDTECEVIAKKLVEEAKLPEIPDDISSSKGKYSGKSKQVASDDDNDEVENSPWCVICNEDAVFVCKDCDDDLYCLECYQ